MATNFHPANPSLGWYPRRRYAKVTETPSALAGPSVDTIRPVLASVAVHATSRGEEAGTRYSNVYDLRNREVLIYYKRAFDKPIRIRVAGELSKCRTRSNWPPLYGVVSYSVRIRTREFGIRTAPGARPSAIVRAIAGRGLLLVGFGVAAGMVAALVLSRFTASLLFGISPTHPATFLGVPAVLVAAFFATILLPALRAARVQPIAALRNE